MKKIFYLFSVLLLTATLVACKNETQNTQTVDNEFISLMSKGLEKRASLTSSSNDLDKLLEAIKYEENNLKTIEGKEFQNPELKTLYEKYLEQLSIQEKNYMHFNDFENYEKHKIFMDSYNERSKIIAVLIDKYGLKLDESLAQEFKTNSIKVNSAEDLDKKIIESFKKTKFTTNDGFVVTGKVKNETGEKITNKTIDAKFIDKDGVTIEVSPYYVDGTWEVNEIRNVEFFLSSDEKKFERIEFSINNY